MNESWKVRAIREAHARPDRAVSPEEQLARALREAPDGLTLTQTRNVLTGCGKDRREEALEAVRSAAWTTETREQRPNRAGHSQSQVVLRALADYLRTGEAD